MEPSNGTEKPILVQLTLRRFGNRRKGDLSEVSTSADKTLLSLSKKLLECPEYRELATYDADTVAYVRARSIPSLFKAGVYQVRARYVQAMDEYLKGRSQGRESLVDQLTGAYQQRVTEAAARLASQFNADDYPSAQLLARQFSMEWRFFTMGAPDAIEWLDPEFVRAEAARLADMFLAAREEGLKLVRAEFAGLVDHLVDRLTPDADGNRKRFKAASVANVSEFLSNFDAKNIAGDTDLEALIGKARALLSGVTPETVRESMVVKDRLKDGFSEIAVQMSGLIEAAPKRFIDTQALMPDAEGRP